jgi:hypothetical protein
MRPKVADGSREGR